jgi:hypothetical protein
VIVYDTQRVDVYPGHLLFGCPMETGFVLGPHSTAQATGTWDQTVVSVGSPTATTQQAPPGRYRLVVNGAVGVPVTLVPG